jgi:hypothetical protein
MSPNEFLIAFNGFRALIGDEAPTAEQWARICEFHTEAVGYEVKQKWAMEEQKRRMEQEIEDRKAEIAKQMAQLTSGIYSPFAQPVYGGGVQTVSTTGFSVPLISGSYTSTI